VNLAGGIAPVIAPTLGVGIATFGGWRAIYGALAIGGTLLFAAATLALGESLARRAGGPLSARRAIAGYLRVATHRVSLGYILIVALNFGCLFAYVSGSSLVLIGLLGVSQRVYGLLFAATSLGLMIGALTNARLSQQGVAPERLIIQGEAAIVITALLLLALTLTGLLTVATLVPIAVVGFIGQGIVRPNAVQGALEPMPEIAGVASAVLSATQMLAGALASALVAELFDGRSASAMTVMMAISACASGAIYVTMVRPASGSDATLSTMTRKRGGEDDREAGVRANDAREASR
jgi:DHA1 family bicyclomycin/chloramphenicol resistance-like MFS transporter